MKKFRCYRCSASNLVPAYRRPACWDNPSWWERLMNWLTGWKPRPASDEVTLIEWCRQCGTPNAITFKDAQAAELAGRG